jgi:hypothetical protein
MSAKSPVETGVKNHLRKEQNLDSQSKTKMQPHNHNQQNLASLDISSTEYRIQIPNQEDSRSRKTNPNKHPIQDRDGRPRDQGHRNPDQIRIAIETYAFKQISAFSSKPLERTPQRHGDQESVSIDQSSSSRKQCKVIDEMFLPLLSKILRYRARQKQNHDYGGSDPEWTVQVGVSIQHV